MVKKYFKQSIIALTLLGMSGYAFVESDLFTLSKNLEIYSNIYKELNETYVDDVEAAGLMRIGINAMLKKLDPYTNYITEAQIEGARLKKFAGGGDIGVKLIKMGDNIVIEEVLEGLPADTMGIKPGAIITVIDDKEVKGKSLEEIELFMKGQPDTDMELTFKPYGQDKEETVFVKRAVIKPKDVAFSKMLNDSIGYVRLSTFLAPKCGLFVKSEIDKLAKENENFKYLVFDLRGNPGGYLRESIIINNIFIEKGQMLVRTSGRDEDEAKEYEASVDPAYPDLPLIVLTNNKSASASEIVSGTMQDLDRGLVVGQRTYGKGLVQQTKDIGFNSKVKLTVAKYYIPTGRCIQAVDYYGDYTDKGAAATIPDSLKNEFRTKNGRIVYDNSGVAPDVEVMKNDKSAFIKGLKDEKAIFKYANYYQAKHDSIVAPLDFDFTDADFEDFVKFVESNKVQFESKTEESLTKLQESTEEEAYYDAVKTEMGALQKKIDELKKKEIRQYKKELKSLLKYEIISRYHYERGRLEASLLEDPNIQESFNIFGDMKKYNELLGKK